MYRAYYGFESEPFNLTPDSRFLYLSRRHEEALAALVFGVTQRKGFIAITGEIGSGKTTLCRAFLNQLDREGATQIALILNPDLSDIELLQAINAEFGLAADATGKRVLLDTLNRFLLEQAAAGNNCVLILDEAQNLPTRTLEQVRMISNLETETAKLIQIVLVGQPELNRMLSSPELEQLNQRITVRYHLEPLDEEEVGRYVAHRLEVARPSRPVRFTREAIGLLSRQTHGVPRRINVICDRALLIGYVEEAWTLDRRHIEKAIGEVTAASAAITGAPPAEAIAPPAAHPSAAKQPSAPGRRPPHGPFRSKIAWLAAALLIVVAVLWYPRAESRRADTAAASQSTAAGSAESGLRLSPPREGAGEPRQLAPKSELSPAAIPATEPTPWPSPTLPPTPTPHPTPTAYPSPTQPPMPTMPPTPSPYPSPSAPPPPTFAPTASPSSSPSPSPSPSDTFPPTPSPSASPSPTESPTESPSPSPSASPTPRRTPERWEVDEEGIVRVDREDLAPVAAILTWLRMKGREVDLAPLRQAPPEQAARLQLAAGRPPLWLRTATLPADIKRIEAWKRPCLLRLDGRQEGISSHLLLRRIADGQADLLDPLRGHITVPAQAVQAHLSAAEGLYFDPDDLAGARPGEESTRVTRLRALLEKHGDLPEASASPAHAPAPAPSALDPTVYDRATAEALARFQQRHGLDSTGVPDGATAWLVLAGE